MPEIDVYTQERNNMVASLSKEQKKQFNSFIKSHSSGFLKKENPFNVRQEYEIAKAIYFNIPLVGHYEPEKTHVEMRLYREQFAQQMQDNKILSLSSDKQTEVMNFATRENLNKQQLDMVVEAVKRDIPLEMFYGGQTPDEMCNIINTYTVYQNTVRTLSQEQYKRFSSHINRYNNAFNLDQCLAIADACLINVPELTEYTPQTHSENMSQKTAAIVASRYNLKVDRSFLDSCQHQNIPMQGWKIHISCYSARDYVRGLSIMLPELIKNNVTFKIVNPQFFQFQPGSNLFGKEFTIYPNENFKMSNFSQRFINYLQETSLRMPSTDHNVGGRMNVRYGQFIARANMYDGYGRIVQDKREEGYYKPDFVEEATFTDILTFYDRIQEKLKKTKDWRLYVQEYLTGREYTSFDKYFINAYELKKSNDLDNVSNYFAANEAFILKTNGKNIISFTDPYVEERFKNLCVQQKIQAIPLTGNSLENTKDLGLQSISGDTQLLEPQMQDVPLVFIDNQEK